MDLSNDVKDHERRISRIDGVLESVATKEDLAKLENRLSETFRQSLEQVRDEIKELHGKQHRLTGIGIGLAFLIPIVLSMASLYIAATS
ncbi:MAG: hypothetical protein OXG60_13770 [Chloroflexi bacterium]|nr:hypothetical protein [Chloroflexota bacterium]